MKSLLSTCILAAAMIVAQDVTLANAQGSKGSGAAAPSPSAAPAGSTASFESQMLAYGGLQHIAKALGKTVCSTNGVDSDNSVIVIYDQTAFATLQSYEAFVANIQVVVSAYQTLIPPNDLQNALKTIFSNRANALETMAQSETDPDKKKLDQYRAKQFAMTLAPIDPFADAASLLSAIAVSANTESPGQITIPDSAMAVALAREIKGVCKNGVTIVYPPLFGNASSSDYASADIQVAIQKLDDIRSSALKAVSAANQVYLTNYPKQTTNTTATTKGKSATDQTVETSTNQSTLAPITGDPVATAGLTDVNGLYDNFMNSLLQVNSSTGMIGSASVIQGYRLAKLLKGMQCTEDEKTPDGLCPIPAGAPVEPYSTWKKKPAFVLLASVVNAGGTQHNHKTLWTALSSGDKITYSGGVVVNVSLWSAGSASPIYLDVLRYRAPFSQMKAPADVTGVDSGDNLK
jgi:hypothetical protein